MAKKKSKLTLEDRAFSAYELFRDLSNELYAEGVQKWARLQRRIYGGDDQ